MEYLLPKGQALEAASDIARATQNWKYETFHKIHFKSSNLVFRTKTQFKNEGILVNKILRKKRQIEEWRKRKEWKRLRYLLYELWRNNLRLPRWYLYLQYMETISERDPSDLSQEWSSSIFGLRWTYQENYDSYSNRR